MTRLAALFLALCLPFSAQAQCGGSWQSFLSGIRAEALAKGLSTAATDSFLKGARQNPAVLKADASQGIFQKPFVDFARQLISADRVRKGAANAQKHKTTFNRIQRDYGVPRGILLSFWAFETDYGVVQGNFNTRNALLTLAHDCRRPGLFRPQVFAAIELTQRGDFSPANTKGAWAGEIGMVQFLPSEIVRNGVDGDGDGHVNLQTSAPDALTSGARVLSSLGWKANQPWMTEVTVPANLDWAASGLNHPARVSAWQKAGVRARSGSLPKGSMSASLLLPMGRNGPAFLVYPNFNVLFEWNKSFVYVTTAAYFATRLEGAPVFNAGNPSPALSGQQMKALQRKLTARGHDVGGIDGILGKMTREAVQTEQERLGLPADAWPTTDLVNRL